MNQISPHSIDALLFDLGGVVINIRFENVFEYWARSSNRNVESIRSKFTFDSYYEQHERGEINASEYFASLRQSLDIDISDDAFIIGWNAIYEEEIPGVSDMLSNIKHTLPIYAFTNSNYTHQKEWSIRYHDVLNHFQKVFVSSEMGVRKPEQEAFEAISREINVPMDRILFFDDSWENVTGARSAGMQAVHVTSPSSIESGLEAILSDA